MDLELHGKVVLVSGGTDGLGLAAARRLLAEGARVAVCGRDPARRARAAAELDAAGEALVLDGDVTRAAEMADFVGAAAEHWGRIDGVLGNAGGAAAGRFEDAGDDAWRDDFDLKVLGTVRLIRLALPHLRAGGGGAVVNVLNIGAKAPRGGSLPTSASRAAGLAVTKALSKELGPDGIRVNAILVGLARTAQWERTAARLGVSVDELHERLVREHAVPLGRLGEREEFADLAAYLLSARASYVTGSAVNLDGGASPAI